MNYLAHVFFSYHDEHLLVGNVLTDMMTLRESREIDVAYREGIRLHRLIDKVTDGHPLHKESLKKLYPLQGKYAPVVMDIFYDYFLGKHWFTYETARKEDVTDRTYAVLAGHLPNLPQRIIPAVERMIEHDFLNSCLDYQKLEFTFERLKRRVRFESNLHNAVKDLQHLEADLENLFLDFFPEAIHALKSFQQE